jgi:mono/diheme cytochrome c family protein
MLRGPGREGVKRQIRWRRGALVAGALGLAVLAWLAAAPRDAAAGFPWADWFHRACAGPACSGPPAGEWEGTWYWLRSPDQEQRVVNGFYTRYCVRCHAIDGRGVWDMPDIPDFTDPRWQACRSDDQLARIILEGRGAVMPPFRGTLSLEEAYAMARFLRTFAEGAASKPDVGKGGDRREQRPEELPRPKSEAPAPGGAPPAPPPAPRPGQLGLELPSPQGP